MLQHQRTICFNSALFDISKKERRRCKEDAKRQSRRQKKKSGNEHKTTRPPGPAAASRPRLMSLCRDPKLKQHRFTRHRDRGIINHPPTRLLFSRNTVITVHCISLHEWRLPPSRQTDAFLFGCQQVKRARTRLSSCRFILLSPISAPKSGTQWRTQECSKDADALNSVCPLTRLRCLFTLFWSGVSRPLWNSATCFVYETATTPLHIPSYTFKV